MAVGKRLSTDEPLTEHDIAERLDKAATRVWRIMHEAREMGIHEQVRKSRYLTNSIWALRAEIEAWDIPSHSMCQRGNCEICWPTEKGPVAE